MRWSVPTSERTVTPAAATPRIGAVLSSYRAATTGRRFRPGTQLWAFGWCKPTHSAWPAQEDHPDGHIKQSTLEFISEARNSCCTCVGASSAHTTSGRQAWYRHRPPCHQNRRDGRRAGRGHRLAAALGARRVEPIEVARLRHALRRQRRPKGLPARQRDKARNAIASEGLSHAGFGFLGIPMLGRRRAGCPIGRPGAGST